MTMVLLICVAAAVVAMAPVLAVGSLRRRAFACASAMLEALATAPSRARARICEQMGLWLAAALLDLGNHLMLSAEERRAIRLRRWLSSPRAHRLGVEAAAVRAGARRLDEVTLEILIGERTQENNPARTLAFSCVVYEPPGRGASDPPEDVPAFFWRIVNSASPGYSGSSVTVEVPELKTALIVYYARPLPPADTPGGRFLDEGVHGGTLELGEAPSARIGAPAPPSPGP
jgi:hypothetical protein